MVRKPAHLDEGLLDHVYMHKMYIKKKRVNAIVINVYFTNHDLLYSFVKLYFIVKDFVFVPSKTLHKDVLAL